MVEQIYSEAVQKLIKSRKKIEEALDVKLDIKNHVVIITGDPADELICLEIIEAMDLGFSVSQALDLKSDDFAFEKVYIKKISKRKDLSQVRARIIGTNRRVLRTIEDLADVELALHDNVVGIIGPIESVSRAENAIKKIIAGSKHANVYAWLEKERAAEKGKLF